LLSSKNYTLLLIFVLLISCSKKRHLWISKDSPFTKHLLGPSESFVLIQSFFQTTKSSSLKEGFIFGFGLKLPFTGGMIKCHFNLLEFV